jgi:parallel beta-helix repeat protein
MGSYSENDLAGTVRAIDVDVRGPVARIHTLAKGRTARGRSGIVLMSSLAGLRRSPRLAAYATTEALDLVSIDKRMGRAASPRRGRRRVLHWRGAHVWDARTPARPTPGTSDARAVARRPEAPWAGATCRAGASEHGDAVLHDEAFVSAPRGASPWSPSPAASTEAKFGGMDPGSAGNDRQRGRFAWGRRRRSDGAAGAGTGTQRNTPTASCAAAKMDDSGCLTGGRCRLRQTLHMAEEETKPLVQRAFPWNLMTAGRAALVAALALATTGGASAAANAAGTQLYVSTTGGSAGTDTSCATAAYSSIQAAIQAAAPNDVVTVCAGVYHTSVTVTVPITLFGQGATIDASGGQGAGVTVVASGARVEGLTVVGATGEGILVVGKPGAPIENVVVWHNVVEGNDQGNPTGAPISASSYKECNATGPVPGDCGEGIHLMVAENSLVSDNVVVNNSGGILLTDEFGPTANNRVVFNTVLDNVLDCGITLAGHGDAGFADGQTAPDKGGVYDNLIAHNILVNNGTKGQGAGVLMATGAPGGAVYDNTVAYNTISDNGLAGVTIHGHTPGEDLNGNVIQGNTISLNNLDGDMDFAPHVDKATTGIIVASASPLTIAIQGNTIVGDANGVWTTGPVTVSGLSTNAFVGVTTDSANG